LPASVRRGRPTANPVNDTDICRIDEKVRSFSAGSGVPALTAVGLILASLVLAIVFHLLLAFPSGRLRGRASVVTVLVAYFVCTVMQAPQWLFGGGSGGPWAVLQIHNSPGLADAMS